MNYSEYSQLFYASNNIPIAYYEDNHLISYFGFTDFFLPNFHIFKTFHSAEKPFSLNIYNDDGYYGFINKGKHSLVIGPVYAVVPKDHIIRSFMHEHRIYPSNREAAKEYLWNLNHCTYHIFFNILSLTYYTLYHKAPSLDEVYSLGSEDIHDTITQKVSEVYYDAREAQTLHGTYQLEQQIIQYIKDGNVAQLEIFLKKIRQSSHILEGIVGDSPLRQAKNIFIALVAYIGKAAAIPSGLDIELTYHLIDQYSIECERLHSVMDVETLQYNMIMDFAKRISESMIPGGLSPEIYSCIQYVNSHINEYMSVTDVADYIKKSRSYTLNHFKRELGFNLGEYIIHAKIQEAKSLLTFTDKPLIEISNYLCFSSQSHFQNVFKKITGETPLSYRKKTQKE